MKQRYSPLRARLGVERYGPDPAVLFAGDSRAGFESVAPIIDSLCSNSHRLEVVLAGGDANLRAWLAERFGNSHIAIMPLDLPGIRDLWLSRGKIRTVVALDDACLLTHSFTEILHRRATPLAQIGAPRTETPRELELVVPADTLHDAQDIIQKLLVLVGRERAWDQRTDQKIVRMIGDILYRSMETPRGRRQLLYFVERLETHDALNTHLGKPKTILCVGNGPSSENPDVISTVYDALFRVNHSWQLRPHLTDPDVVFTGERSTMRRVKRATFGVRSTSTEKSLLTTRALKRFKGKLAYFVADRFFGLTQDDRRRGMRPTNGAIMIAVAASLAPDRLVIAGIDMFRHPDGIYPGSGGVTNAYTPAHSEDMDLAVILSALDQYKGELVILSDVLKREWDAHRKQVLQA